MIGPGEVSPSMGIVIVEAMIVAGAYAIWGWWMLDGYKDEVESEHSPIDSELERE